MSEGYMALCVSILTGRNPEAAFRALDVKEEKRRTEWTEDMLLEIDQMRKDGMKWWEIGEALGIKRATVQKAYKRWRDRNDIYD